MMKTNRLLLLLLVCAVVVVVLLVMPKRTLPPPPVTTDIGISSHDPLPAGSKLCLLGDTGMGNAAQRRVATALASEGCDQVRLLGDIIYREGLQPGRDVVAADACSGRESSTNPWDNQFCARFLNIYRVLLEEQAVPFHLVMGNHDHRGDTGLWLGAADNYPAIIFPNHFYAQSYGDVCILSLDTILRQQREYGQQAWLQDTLQALQGSCKLSIALGHFAYRSVGAAHGDATGAERRFLRRNVVGHVDAYISGHEHNLQVLEEQGTLLLVAGGGGARLTSIATGAKAQYANSSLGFVTLEFKPAADSVQAIWTVREVRDDGTVRTGASGQLNGQGIRLRGRLQEK
jgi:tartrate-resistant acid phosphatase type 5